LANFEFASDGKGGTIVYDPPVTAAQAGNVAANNTNDRRPLGTAEAQRLAPKSAALSSRNSPHRLQTSSMVDPKS
jgi:hypothetical protein